jgi:hypothetical protein
MSEEQRKPAEQQKDPAEQQKNRKESLALALCKGQPVAAWAHENGVPERTAYFWAKDREVRAIVDSYRRELVDQAVGTMSGQVNWAVQGIRDLGSDASSESVRLSALKAVIANTVALSKFASLEQRVAELEERVNVRTGQSGRAACYAG